MLSRLRMPGVLPSLMMFIIVAWALLAVLMLTITLVNVGRIDNRVALINDEVGPIDNELDSVVLAKKTGDISGQIREAAVPLTGQLTTTSRSAKGIDASAEKILGNARSINSEAEEVNGTVGRINRNVDSIGATLNSVEANALSIGDSVDEINGSFTGVLSEVVSIDDGAAGINRRANVVTSQANDILADLDNVNDVQVPAIMTNAEGIENSPLLLNDVDAAGILNQLAAARLAATQAESEAAPLPLPDLPDLPEPPAPVQVPTPDLDEPLQLGPRQSPADDTGSILGGLGGGL